MEYKAQNVAKRTKTCGKSGTLTFQKSHFDRVKAALLHCKTYAFAKPFFLFKFPRAVFIVSRFYFIVFPCVKFNGGF